MPDVQSEPLMLPAPAPTQKHVLRVLASGMRIATFGTGRILGRASDGRPLRTVMVKDTVDRNA